MLHRADCREAAMATRYGRYGATPASRRRSLRLRTLHNNLRVHTRAHVCRACALTHARACAQSSGRLPVKWCIALHPTGTDINNEPDPKWRYAAACRRAGGQVVAGRPIRTEDETDIIRCHGYRNRTTTLARVDTRVLPNGFGRHSPSPRAGCTACWRAVTPESRGNLAVHRSIQFRPHRRPRDQLAYARGRM